MRAFYGPGMNIVHIALENLVTWLYSERGREMDSSYLSKGKTGKLFQWTVLPATVSFPGFTIYTCPSSHSPAHQERGPQIPGRYCIHLKVQEL